MVIMMQISCCARSCLAHLELMLIVNEVYRLFFFINCCQLESSLRLTQSDQFGQPQPLKGGIALKRAIPSLYKEPKKEFHPF